MGTTSVGTYNQLHNLTLGLVNPSRTNIRKGYDVDGVLNSGGLVATASYLSAKDLI